LNNSTLTEVHYRRIITFGPVFQNASFIMDEQKVLVTGASGFVGSAIARAFRSAGWATYGLIQYAEAADALEQAEIIPLVADISDLTQLRDVREIGFDIIVSNTEDRADPAGHLAYVGAMLNYLTESRGAGQAKRPLVLFTSGSKDYGNMDEVHGDAALRPHTEESPIQPHPFAAARAAFAQALLVKESAPYDVVVLRPALVYGRSAGLYGLLFDLAQKSPTTIVFQARPNTIMHSVHVDDCAAAYVALATYPDRAKLVGQTFNIANAQYETTEQVATALAKVYGKQLAFTKPAEAITGFDAHLLADTSQWLSSQKVRALTGWTERMPTLSAGMAAYRLAYEAYKK
jgi:nucleoside-diphosphate-sugar epimerase